MSKLRNVHVTLLLRRRVAYRILKKRLCRGVDFRGLEQYLPVQDMESPKHGHSVGQDLFFHFIFLLTGNIGWKWKNMGKKSSQSFLTQSGRQQETTF